MTSPFPAASRRTAVRLALAGLLAALAVTAARAQDDATIGDADRLPDDAPIPHAVDDPDAIAQLVVEEPNSAWCDAAVYAAVMPNPHVLDPGVVAQAVASALRAPVDPRSLPVVPATVNPFAPRPITLAVSALAANPLMEQLDGGQTFGLHAAGLPGANAPSSDPFVRVLPRAVNPNDVAFGARWAASDSIALPWVPPIGWSATADLLAGPMPPGAGSIRRTLRLNVQWDTAEDLQFGLQPGVQRGGGNSFDHYVTGLQANTLAGARPARWHGFVELSGAKLGQSALIDNATAQVHAGASYATSNTTQLDVSVSRGTTPVSDFQSSLGLRMHF